MARAVASEPASHDGADEVAEGPAVPESWQPLDGVAAFARGVRASDDALTVLHRLTGKLRQSMQLPAASAALLVNDELRVVAVANRRRFALGLVHTDGPSLTAARLGSPVVVPDLAERRTDWPRYCRVAAEYGVVAVAALPLGTDAMVGSIEIYDRDRREWTASDLRTASAFADVA